MGSWPVHNPLLWHFRSWSPSRSNPVEQKYSTISPSNVVVSFRLPLTGVPGSPQSTWIAEKKNINVNMYSYVTRLTFANRINSSPFTIFLTCSNIWICWINHESSVTVVAGCTSWSSSVNFNLTISRRW